MISREGSTEEEEDGEDVDAARDSVWPKLCKKERRFRVDFGSEVLRCFSLRRLLVLLLLFEVEEEDCIVVAVAVVDIVEFCSAGMWSNVAGVVVVGLADGLLSLDAGCCWSEDRLLLSIILLDSSTSSECCFVKSRRFPAANGNRNGENKKLEKSVQLARKSE